MGLALMAAGAAVIAWFRAEGSGLTEAQSFMEFAPLWASAAISILSGAYLMSEGLR